MQACLERGCNGCDACTDYEDPTLLDDAERVVEDDQAARSAAYFRDQALLNQQLRACRLPASRPGWCANCGALCPVPETVYCDADCRSDHEQRLRLPSTIGGHA